MSPVYHKVLVLNIVITKKLTPYTQLIAQTAPTTDYIR